LVKKSPSGDYSLSEEKTCVSTHNAIY